MSPKLARAIAELIGQQLHTVRHLRDKFSSDTKDIDWIRALGEDRDRSWIVISGDYRILRNKHELEAWKRARLTMFVFAKGWMNRGFWEQAVLLVRWWPFILDTAPRFQPGAALEVPLGSRIGKFKQLF
jgi:PIN like domain